MNDSVQCSFCKSYYQDTDEGRAEHLALKERRCLVQGDVRLLDKVQAFERQIIESQPSLPCDEKDVMHLQHISVCCVLPLTQTL